MKSKAVARFFYAVFVTITILQQRAFQDLIDRGSAWHFIKMLGVTRSRRSCDGAFEMALIWNTSVKSKDQEADQTRCEHEICIDEDMKAIRDQSIKAIEAGTSAGWANVLVGTVFAMAISVLSLNTAEAAVVAATTTATFAYVAGLLAYVFTIKDYHAGLASFKQLVLAKEAVQCNYIHYSFF